MFRFNREIEIIKTPCVVVENDPVFDDEFPLEFPILRRTHTLSCRLCHTFWGGVIYNGTTRSRLCTSCTQQFKFKVSNLRKNLHLMLNVLENKNRIHEEILEFGMHPDRVYQTQLVDTLYLFRQPSN